MRGEAVELVARHCAGGEKSPYERLLGDAIRGDTSLFTQRRQRRGGLARRRADSRRRGAARRIRARHLGARDRRERSSPATKAGTTRSPRRARRASRRGMVFLLDVDNTLLDNDRFGADLGARLEQLFGAAERERYWAIYAELRDSLGLRRLPGDPAEISRRARGRSGAPADVGVPARVSVRRAPVPERPGGDRPPPHARDSGGSLRRRRGVPAAQGPALRHLVGGRGARADLHAQGTHARGSEAALPGSALRDGGRQAAAAGGDEASARRAADDDLRAPGPLRHGIGWQRHRSGARPEPRADRRSALVAISRTSTSEVQHESRPSSYTISARASGSTRSPARCSTTAPCAATSTSSRSPA